MARVFGFLLFMVFSAVALIGCTSSGGQPGGETAYSSLSAASASEKELLCTFEDGKTYLSSKYYIKGSEYRLDSFVKKADGESVSSTLLFKGDFVYTWNSLSENGVKTSASKVVLPGIPLTSFKCIETAVASEIEVPAGRSFIG